MVPLSFVQKDALIHVRKIHAAMITGAVPVSSYLRERSVEPSRVHSLFPYALLSHYQQLPLPYCKRDTILLHRFLMKLVEV